MKKLKAFQDWMRQERLDLVIFFNNDAERVDSNFRYFSGYTGFGLLGITQKRAMLAVPRLERLRAKRESALPVICCAKRLLPALKKALHVRAKRVGIDKSKVSVQVYMKLKKDIDAQYVDVSEKCLELRSSKTSEEIAIMKKACAITDDIFHGLCVRFRSFKSEEDVARFIKEQSVTLADGVSFSPIVGSGKNACMAHHVPDKFKLNRGFCVMDFGVKLKGYCSDMTRTIYIGQPTAAEVDLYHKVLEVQQACIKKCVVGADFGKIDSDARQLFGPLGKKFIHLIGHGVGLDIHEQPNPKKVLKNPITRLEDGSVITIEPGIYIDDKLGIRIEDDILVTKKGPVLLTKSGKNLLVIKK